MVKVIKNGFQAQQAVMRGVDALERAVRVTLGPSARNVMLEQKVGYPLVCSDGVTIARSVDVPDPIENLGVRLVREAATKTNDVAGDGTTTAIVLARAIANGGFAATASGVNPMTMKHGINKGVMVVKDALTSFSTPLISRKQIEQVATLSAHSSSIGVMIADAFERIGRNGVVTIEDSTGMYDELRVVEGMQYDRGYVSTAFVTDNEKQIAVLENPYIILYDGTLSDFKEVLSVLDKIVQSGHKDVLIIADEVAGAALHVLVVNKAKGVVNCVAARAPAYGDRRKSMLQDIAIFTGGTVFSPSVGNTLRNATLQNFGRAKRVQVSNNETIIAEGAGTPEAISTRVKQLELLLYHKNTQEFDRELLKEQIAKLQGGIAVIKVGGTSDTELRERKERYEDALAATKSALEEGIVPGGGVAFLRALPALKKLHKYLDSPDERAGVRVLSQALTAPLFTIANNTGVEAAAVVEYVKNGVGNFGYNAETGVYGDMLEEGVIDPTKVVRTVLENAASVATMLLTMEATVTQKEE